MLVLIKGKSSAVTRKAQAVLMIHRGKAEADILEMTSYSKRHAQALRKNYLAKGAIALTDKRKGQPKEILTKAQRTEVIETVKTKRPDEVGLYGEYWTTGLLAKFIELRYEAKYKSKTSHYLIFSKAAFTFHKPGAKYQKHDAGKVRKWKRANKSKVLAALNNPERTVLCADEIVLTSKTTFQKIWLPKGEYPKIDVSNKKENRSVYGFLNVKTGQEHAFKTLKQNMYITAEEVLPQLRCAYPAQEIQLIWDNAPWHVGSKVKEFFERDKHIEVINFPPYSPELNPQEHVWKEGRSKVTHNHYIEDIDATANEFIDYLNVRTFPYKLIGISVGS